MLSLNVAESSRNRQASRNHTMRSQYVLLLWLILSRHLHMLDRLSLVNASAIFDDSLDFIVFIRSMVSREQEQLLAFVG